MPTIPTPKPVNRTEAIEAAIEMYENVGRICENLGIQAAVGVFNLPRGSFDEVIDYMDDTNGGVLVVENFRRPMWMKRCAQNVAVYTSELPAEA